MEFRSGPHKSDPGHLHLSAPDRIGHQLSKLNDTPELTTKL